jgi:DNA mismatch endonuclease (patch repair protein)
MGSRKPLSFDVLTPKQRSYCMSRIRGKNTKPEVTLRRALWAMGLRYRIHHRIPGRPDVVFVSLKLVVFVDGCFWHGCPHHGVKPKNNAKFWTKKLRENRTRDKRTNAKLVSQGWAVFRFWEHEIEKDLARVVKRVVSVVLRRHSKSKHL